MSVYFLNLWSTELFFSLTIFYCKQLRAPLEYKLNMDNSYK